VQLGCKQLTAESFPLYVYLFVIDIVPPLFKFYCNMSFLLDVRNFKTYILKIQRFVGERNTAMRELDCILSSSSSVWLTSLQVFRYVLVHLHVLTTKMNMCSLICTRSQSVNFPNFWISAPAWRWSEVPLVLNNSMRKTSHLKADSNTASKNNFASFYGEESFVAAFTRRQHKSPSWARLIQSTSFQLC
jgi:hypothetical protein